MDRVGCLVVWFGTNLVTIFHPKYNRFEAAMDRGCKEALSLRWRIVTRWMAFLPNSGGYDGFH
eukprot:scaffold6712_cov142-Cylindrotheca_fusiformis.AAC.4